MATKSKVTVSVTQSLPSGHYRRGGIIPYTLTPNGDILVAVGVERESKDLGSFSGSIRPPESIVDAAIREFAEETYGVFGTLTRTSVTSAIAVSSAREVILFVPLRWDNNDIQTRFVNLQERHSEMAKIEFLTGTQFVHALADDNSEPFYAPVADLLREALRLYGSSEEFLDALKAKIVVNK